MTPPKFQVSKKYHTDIIEKLLDDLSVLNTVKEKYKPLDLGFGEMDYNPPQMLRSALSEAALSDDYRINQYSPTAGLPRLVKAVSTLYSKLLNRHLNPDKNIIITVGATEALYSVFQTYTLPKDEWILIEPYFFLYLSMIKSADGVAKFVALKPMKTSGGISSAHWTFDREEMSKLFNNKTKGIVINSPNNPLGKVFTLEELSFIAELAQKWNTIVVYDEVYQFLTFDNRKHIEIASLPGMFERTITISSADKIFGATGYRVGWAYGASNLIANLKIFHAIAIFSSPTPNQEAVAIALEKEIASFGKPHSYLETFKRSLEAKRNYMYRILQETGMTPILPEGGYYMIANWTTMGDFKFNQSSDISKDFKFDIWLMKNIKVYGLPLSLFYDNAHRSIGEDSLRFTMTKKNETLEHMEELIKKWKQTAKKNFKTT